MEKQARGTEYSVSNGDTTWTVRTGEQIRYSIIVQNVGGQDVSQITVEDVLPSNVVPMNQDGTPIPANGDTIQFSIDSILKGGFFRYDYVGRVDTLFASLPIRLVNRSVVSSKLDTLLSNNTASAEVTYIPLKQADLMIVIRGIGDSSVVTNGDTIRYVHQGGRADYTVSLVNQGELACRDIQVQNILPPQTTLINFSGANYQQKEDTLIWSLDRLESRGRTAQFTYSCRVDSLMPPWQIPLINRVNAIYNGDFGQQYRSGADTLIAVGFIPPDPQIRVYPSEIEPKDTVRIEVMSPVNTVYWDIVVFFENNEIVTTYGDPFILQNELTPNTWIAIQPPFDDTRMRTDQDRERVGVVIKTVDIWGVVRSDTSYFSIRSSDEYYLDKNVFRPNRDGRLEVRLRLSNNRHALIRIYDIAGGFVKTLADGYFEAGWNPFYWSGTDENGKTVGSGIYVAVLTSGGMRQALKFILVR
jgi:uncharacterized repeat protein (TIGR01451 family)